MGFQKSNKFYSTKSPIEHENTPFTGQPVKGGFS